MYFAELAKDMDKQAIHNMVEREKRAVKQRAWQREMDAKFAEQTAARNKRMAEQARNLEIASQARAQRIKDALVAAGL